MKNIIKISILLLLLLLTIWFRAPITNYIMENFIFKKGVVLEEPNPYHLSYSFAYVQETDDFFAKDKQHLMNIIYTALNHGFSGFYFYCDYDNCEEDVTTLIENKEMTDLNNFLHPYNTYRKLQISINSFRKISVFVEKSYTDNHIIQTEQKLNDIMNEIIKDTMSTKEKIKTFHDYIIHITKYDQEYIDNDIEDIDHPSHKAIGPLFYGKALCGGYTEIMSIFLNRLNIPNYRISSPYHIWNLVNIDNQWLHIDLTWDDPSTEQDLLLDTFLLISTDKLQEYNTNRHIFNQSIYSEAMITPQEEN